MLSTNFTGIVRDTNKITRCNENGRQRVETSFVELEKTNPKDMDALENISENWGSDAYSEMIYEYMCVDTSECPDAKLDHTYVLTTQQSDFEEINPDEILGTVLFKEYKDTNNKILLLQTHPEYMYKENRNSEYLGIGTAIIDSLKNLYEEKPIECFAVEDAIKFYQKNGFVHNDSHKSKNAQIWYG